MSGEVVELEEVTEEETEVMCSIFDVRGPCQSSHIDCCVEVERNKLHCQGGDVVVGWCIG